MDRTSKILVEVVLDLDAFKNLYKEMKEKIDLSKYKMNPKTGDSAARWRYKNCNHHFEEGNFDKVMMKGFCPFPTRT